MQMNLERPNSVTLSRFMPSILSQRPTHIERGSDPTIVNKWILWYFLQSQGLQTVNGPSVDICHLSLILQDLRCNVAMLTIIDSSSERDQRPAHARAWRFQQFVKGEDNIQLSMSTTCVGNQHTIGDSQVHSQTKSPVLSLGKPSLVP